MKAVLYDRYGGPELLHLGETIAPPLKRGYVLVNVHAAALNPIDCEVRKGRFKFMTGRKFPRIPGSDFAGEVVQASPEIGDFKKGDRVYGFTEVFKGGSYAEVVSVPASTISHVPDTLSWEDAASIPLAALTALQGLRDQAQLAKGQSVLINGASGGVGVHAVQIAKILGAEVTAICSYRNTDRMRDLGADFVIDYTQTNYLEQPRTYDVFFDVFGNQSYSKTRHLLSPAGHYVSTIPTPGNFLSGLTNPFRNQQVHVVVVKSHRENLALLAEWLHSGLLKPIVDKTFAFSEADQAQSYLETRRARGKVVLHHWGV
ncbi:NAD(P)-dependent alcohol dehydrogenase [Pontibacter sp. G13]|uniref:NAD(P)-dependent alcohol dehydrogenase n=1 Tax=Pontibacter sp. G13 TaxID=3074898 RepID=UPI00288C209E|nr:NAD(P)-dependent alcohol dehydrogenase [Pontibacter sp. G13]WNJ16849.1 NAD(P)-dependent alcohol dehydrogenase [Pontibacter sp. G13]